MKKTRIIPAYIKRKKYKGDIEALRIMGRKGGRKTAERYAAKKYFDEIEMIRRKHQNVEMAMSANEHIIPIDDSSPSFISPCND